MERSSDLDPYPILKALGVPGTPEAEPLSGGTDTSMWRVQCGETTFALRVFRPDQVKTYEREVVAMDAAASAGLPVPRVHAKGMWQDRPALLLSWCSGQRVEQELVQRPWRAWRLGTILGRMQAAIHKVPAPTELLQAPDAWIDWAGPDEGDLKDRLRALEPRTTVLLHLDYHDLNVMTDGKRITGVLDWANGLAGDPRACFARTQLLQRVIPAALNWSFRTRVHTWVLVQAWKRGYQQVAGPLRDMELFYAWAVTARDLMNKPEVHGLEPFIEDIRRWTATWKRRAGLHG